MLFAYIERNNFSENILVEVPDNKKDDAKDSKGLTNSITIIYVGF